MYETLNEQVFKLITFVHTLADCNMITIRFNIRYIFRIIFFFVVTFHNKCVAWTINQHQHRTSLKRETQYLQSKYCPYAMEAESFVRWDSSDDMTWIWNNMKVNFKFVPQKYIDTYTPAEFNTVQHTTTWYIQHTKSYSKQPSAAQHNTANNMSEQHSAAKLAPQ